MVPKININSINGVDKDGNFVCDTSINVTSIKFYKKVKVFHIDHS